jgi:membrane protein DedA with SNARE-associated domain
MEVSSLVTQLSTGSIFVIAGSTIIANLFPGIPEELFIILMGSIVASGAVPFWVAFLTLWVSLMLVDQVLYWTVRSGGDFLKKVFNTFKNKVFGDALDTRLDFINRHITKIVVGSRFVFQVRFLGPFLAGTVKMPWKKFTFWNAFALALYIPLMLILGMYLGDRVERIADGIRTLTNSILAGILVILVIMAIVLIHREFLKWIRTGKEKKKSFFGIEKRDP